MAGMYPFPHMHQWNVSALVQIMTCRLFGDKPLPEPTPNPLSSGPLGKLSVKFEPKCKIFHSWNTFKNVYEMVVFFRGRWVNHNLHKCVLKQCKMWLNIDIMLCCTIKRLLWHLYSKLLNVMFPLTDFDGIFHTSVSINIFIKVINVIIWPFLCRRVSIISPLT